MKKIKKISVAILSVSFMFSALGCSSKKTENKINYSDWKKAGYEIAYTNGYKENEDTVQMYKHEKKTNPIFTYEQKDNKFYYCDSIINSTVLNIESGNFDEENVNSKTKTKIKESLESNLKDLNTDKNTIKKIFKENNNK